MTAYSNLERFYNIVFDQQFSPAGGKYLATCDNFGQLAVFSLSSALGPSSNKTPLRLLKAHKGPAYCLETADTLLVSGGSADIKVWKWAGLCNGSSKEVECLATLLPPVGRFGVPETNGLAYNEQGSTLYSGGGDCRLHAWDLTRGEIKASYSGHTDYIHCVCVVSGSGQVISGAEDGTVRVWDPSSPRNPVHTIKPKESGQWIGCVATDSSGDWMVCGGSSCPSLYHLRSLSQTVSLPVPKGVATQSAIFVKDRVITAGSEPSIRHWTINGEALSVVPCGLGHTFSLVFNAGARQYEVLSVTGDSSSVHIFTNLGYKAFSLTVSPPS